MNGLRKAIALLMMLVLLTSGMAALGETVDGTEVALGLDGLMLPLPAGATTGREGNYTHYELPEGTIYIGIDDYQGDALYNIDGDDPYRLFNGIEWAVIEQEEFIRRCIYVSAAESKKLTMQLCATDAESLAYLESLAAQVHYDKDIAVVNDYALYHQVTSALDGFTFCLPAAVNYDQTDDTFGYGSDDFQHRYQINMMSEQIKSVSELKQGIMGMAGAKNCTELPQCPGVWVCKGEEGLTFGYFSEATREARFVSLFISTSTTDGEEKLKFEPDKLMPLFEAIAASSHLDAEAGAAAAQEQAEARAKEPKTICVNAMLSPQADMADWKTVALGDTGLLLSMPKSVVQPAQAKYYTAPQYTAIVSHSEAIKEDHLSPVAIAGGYGISVMSEQDVAKHYKTPQQAVDAMKDYATVFYPEVLSLPVGEVFKMSQDGSDGSSMIAVYVRLDKSTNAVFTIMIHDEQGAQTAGSIISTLRWAEDEQ